jgi:hypothetical protein
MWIKSAGLDTYERGIAFLYLGNYSKAREYLSSSSLSVDSDTSTNYTLLARAEYGLGNFEAAEADLQKVLAVHPRDAFATSGLGIVRHARRLKTRGEPTPQTPLCDTLHNEGKEAVQRIPGVTILPIPNMPFSAKETIEWSKTLADGTVSCISFFTMVARDKNGRVRRETRHRIDPLTDNEPKLLTFTINDPQKNMSTVCTVASQTCIVRPYAPAKPAEWEKDLKGVGEDRTDLGSDTIEGVPVLGTRIVKSEKGGGAGGTASVSDELWLSEAYQMTIYEVRNDPHTGTIDLRLTNCHLGDPDSKYFEIPDNFEITDNR